jgi:hypothetical protein
MNTAQLPRSARFLRQSPWLALALSVALVGGCSDGDDGAQGPAGPPGGGGSTSTEIVQGDDLPGIELVITGLRGGSGAGGRFLPGDRITFDFTVEKSNGDEWDLSEFGRARALVSGPTSNYQRVIAEVTDLATAAVENPSGGYSYTFAVAIPSTYLAPYNDSASFGLSDGELTGQPLLNGTYTLGAYVAWDYTVEGDAYRDAGNATFDFVIGNTGSVESRAVVGQENCNQCHSDLQAHGQMRHSVTLCLMCHTAGAEDRNNANVAGGTPGVSIDFRVMIHKLHNGWHLPSVLGIGTNVNGTRDYAATPQSYQMVGFGDSLHDYSHIGYPRMPSAYVSYLFDSTGQTYQYAAGNGPMPRDQGYSALTLSQKLLEDKVRAGAVDCASCHGDPDGAGPFAAPAQGDFHQSNPTRQACGSCHDDIDWTLPYTSNGQTMPAQNDDSACTLCHEASGNPLAVFDAHRHPYENPSFNTGANVEFTAIGGGTGPGGNHIAGDPVSATFSVTDDSGTDLSLNDLTRFQMIVVGPSSNPQWLSPNANNFDFTFRKSGSFTGNGTITKPTVSSGAIAQAVAVVFTSSTTFDVVGSVSATLPAQAIGAGSGSTAPVSYNGLTFTVTQGTTAFANGDRWYFEAWPLAASYSQFLPRDLVFERLGAATGGAQTLTAGNTPVYWGREVVYEATTTGASSVLTGSGETMARYIVADASTLAGVAVGDRLVIDAGGPSEEYCQVSRIETASPVNGADYGALDRFFVTVQTRYAHGPGEVVQEVTLSTKRQGIDYTLAQSGATGVDLLAGRFTAGRAVLMSYRTHVRFGYYRAAGDTLQDVYLPSTGDSEDVEASWGDWTALPIVDGTYTVGAWTHRDFTVTPLGILTATGAQTNLATDNTTYRMISPPAKLDFLFGGATELTTRGVIADGASCNRCHGDIQGHGNGRRGWETCLLCHASPGMEDAAQYAFNNWYIGPTPGVTMDFRTMLHKIHMGKELANASTYEVNGIFLGVAYPVGVEDIGYPSLPGGTRNCESCHGDGNPAWLAPADRDHPNSAIPQVREWRAVCGSCHDSNSASAHIDVQTAASGAESCSLCHGPGKEWDVERRHKAY